MLPVELSMRNFFSHKDSCINFSEFKSALLIGNTEGDYARSNGSGKSAVFEAILWCLFNRSRSLMMDDIILWGESSCHVCFEFLHNEVEYMITRKRSRVSSSSSVELLKKSDEGLWEDISCSTSGDTNKRIQELISLDYKTFLNSVYFRQRDISEFSEADPARKKEVLKSIVDISKWDEYEKFVKLKLKNMHKESDALKESIDTLHSKKERFSKLEIELNEEKNAILTNKLNRDSAEKSIERISSQYIIMKKNLDTDSYDKIIEDIERLKKERARESDRLISCSSSINKYNKKVSEISSKIDFINKEVDGIIYKEDTDQTTVVLNNALINKKSGLKSFSGKLCELQSVVISRNECYTCNQFISEELYDDLVLSQSDKINDCNSKIQILEKNIGDAQKKIDENNKSIENNLKLDRARGESAGLVSEFEIIKDHLSKISLDKEEICATIDSATNQIKTNNDVLDSLKDEDFRTLRVKKNVLVKSRAALIEDIASINKRIGVLTEKTEAMRKDLAGIKVDKEEFEKLLSKISLYERLSRLYGKSGIQTILLDAVIEDLEVHSNKLLSIICNDPIVINLETQRLGSDGKSVIETLDLKVRMNGVSQNFNSLSGGEQFRVSLALRIALSEIANNHGGSSLEFLLLDEINSPLDRHGIDTLFTNVIGSLEERYKILIVTHDDSLKENFDNIIDITKVNGESSVSLYNP